MFVKYYVLLESIACVANTILSFHGEEEMVMRNYEIYGLHITLEVTHSESWTNSCFDIGCSC